MRNLGAARSRAVLAASRWRCNPGLNAPADSQQLQEPGWKQLNPKLQHRSALRGRNLRR